MGTDIQGASFFFPCRKTCSELVDDVDKSLLFILYSFYSLAHMYKSGSVDQNSQLSMGRDSPKISRIGLFKLPRAPLDRSSRCCQAVDAFGEM